MPDFVFLHVFGFFLQIPFIACRLLLLFMVAAACSRHSEGSSISFYTKFSSVFGVPINPGREPIFDKNFEEDYMKMKEMDPAERGHP